MAVTEVLFAAIGAWVCRPWMHWKLAPAGMPSLTSDRRITLGRVRGCVLPEYDTMT
jgi:hypothetical protein